MVSCAVVGCTNRSATNKNGLTFHRFPKNENQRHLWILVLRRLNWQPTPSSAVCSTHFHESCFDQSLSRVKLKEYAVPSIFPSYSSYQQKGRKKLAYGREKLMMQCDLKETTENEECKKNTEKSTAARTTLKPIVIYVKACSESEDKSSTSNVNIAKSSICTVSAVSQDPNFVSESPLELKRKLRLATDKIISLNQKLRVAQQKCRRLGKKVKSLKPAIRFLKQENQMTTEDLRTIFYDTPLKLLREL